MLFATLRTEFGGREETVHVEDRTTRPLGFVAEEHDELTPTGVGDRLCQLAILDHALDVQVFQADSPVLVDQLAAQLVVEVSPLIGDPFVVDGQPMSSFRPAVRALLLAAQSALSNLETPLCSPQVLGGFHLVALGCGDEIDQPQVDAEHSGPGAGIVKLDLTLDADVELAALGSRNGAVLHLAFQGAMGDDLDPTDLGQIDSVAFQLEPLGIAKRLDGVPGFEPGKSSGLAVLAGPLALVRWPGALLAHAEPVVVGTLQVLEGLLQDLTVSLGEPDVVGLLLEHSQQGRGRFIAQALAGFLVDLVAQGEEVIVDESSMAELNPQFSLLRLIGVDAKPEALSALHLDPFLFRDIPLDDLQADRTYRRDEAATCPQTGQSFFEPGELLSEGARRIALDFAHDFVDPYSWIASHEQVYVIGHHFHIENLVAVFLLFLQNQFFKPHVNSAAKNLSAVFGAEDHMVLATVDDGVI